MAASAPPASAAPLASELSSRCATPSLAPAFTDAIEHLLSEALDAAPCSEEHFWALLQYAHKMWMLAEGASTKAFVSMVMPLVATDALKAKLALGLLFEIIANEHGVPMREEAEAATEGLAEAEALVTS